MSDLTLFAQWFAVGVSLAAFFLMMDVAVRVVLRRMTERRQQHVESFSIRPVFHQGDRSQVTEVAHPFCVRSGGCAFPVKCMRECFWSLSHDEFTGRG